MLTKNSKRLWSHTVSEGEGTSLLDGSTLVLPKPVVRSGQGFSEHLTLVWPKVTAPHCGASPPHGTTRVPLQRGGWGPTASGPWEPAGSPSTSKVTGAVSQVGLIQAGREDQGRDYQWAGLSDQRQSATHYIPVMAEEALTSPSAPTTSAWGLGRFLRFIGVGGTGASSGQQTACTGQSWKSLACPLQMAIERIHYSSQTHWQAGLFEGGVCVWAVSATSFTRSWNTLLSHQHHHSPTSCQHLVLSNFYFLTPLVDVKWISGFSCAFPRLLIKLISHLDFLCMKWPFFFYTLFWPLSSFIYFGC